MFKCTISQLLYKYFGPTTIHIQHELILISTLCLFMNASFYTTYHINTLPVDLFVNNDNGNCLRKEFLYVMLSTIWLSRHLIQRIICTTEINTSTSNCGKILTNGNRKLSHPSWLSSFYKVFIWLSSGGQYFDIPFCPIQFTLYDPSQSGLDSINQVSNTHHHHSNNNTPHNITKKKRSSAFRSVIQTTEQIFITSPGLGDHQHHRQLNKINNESLCDRETPPIHLLYMVQILIIIPLIVVPISLAKFLYYKLRSRKRKGLDDDILGINNNHHHNSNNNRRHHRHSNNAALSSNVEFDTFGGDDDYDNYMKIHLTTQKQINSRLDKIWIYTPSAQFIVYFVTILTVAYLGINFYSFGVKSILSRGGSGSGFTVDPRYREDDSHLVHTGNPYNLPGPRHGLPVGTFSSVLNAALMKKRFQVKQSSGNYNGIIMRIILSIIDKMGIGTWKATFYSPWGMFYMISAWGILSSLIVFGRIMLPLPDLTSGVRDQLSGRGSGKLNKQKRKEKLWPESYSEVSNGNKFILYSKILILRMIENVIVCAILPQSSYICKATGYCTVEPTIFEIGDPAAILSSSSRGLFDSLIRDRLVGNIIILSVLVSTMMILLAHIVVVDRTCLSFEAINYIQGYSTNGVRVGRRASNNSGSDSWNENNGNEKKRNVFYTIRDWVYEVFSKEMGALSTSQIMSFIFNVFAIHSMTIMVLTCFYFVSERDCYALILTLLATFTASEGSHVDAFNYGEIEEIAQEINALHAKDEKVK